MRVVFRILALAGATVVLGVSVVWFINGPGKLSWASSLSVSWFIVVWLSALQLLTPLWLPNWYYLHKDFEMSGRIYELIGVLLLRKLLRREPIHILAPKIQHSGQRESLPVLESEMRIAETIHVYSFVSTFLLFGFSLFNVWLKSAAWLMLFNILLNIYPVILQRYNRVRLKILIEKRPPN